ncbi:hypothetical protein AcW2_005834 [Taiwanofungus camphoratus]|nr:hypothetical protein AcW2_005834 [Antrodia cinnamomea]
MLTACAVLRLVSTDSFAATVLEPPTLFFIHFLSLFFDSISMKRREVRIRRQEPTADGRSKVRSIQDHSSLAYNFTFNRFNLFIGSSMVPQFLALERATDGHNFQLFDL